MKSRYLTCAVLAASIAATAACDRNGTGWNSGRAPQPGSDVRQPAGTTASPELHGASGARDEQALGTSGTEAPADDEKEDADGLGPDAAITLRVQARYAADDVVTGRDIEVDTRDRVVILTGSVDSASERQRAEELARAIEGVTRVVNDLRIASPR